MTRQHHHALTPDERRNVRELLDKLLAEEGGVVRALSRRLHISQTGLSNVFNGVFPPGMTIARALATAQNVPLDAILRGVAPPPGEAPYVGTLPGWAEAEAAARAAQPWIPAAAWELARQVRLPYAPKITAEWAAALATDVARSM